MIRTNKTKELDRILHKQKDCKKKFHKTADTVNGYLKEQIEKLPKGDLKS